MSHVLILGATGTGKTRLLRTLAAGYRRRGVATLAWTPIPHEFRDVAEVYTDLDAFLERVGAMRRCAVIVDEAGEAVSQRQIHETATLATRSRHLGHSVHFAAQRAAGLISPLVRHQCERLYVFRVARSDARALADERGRPELESAAELEPGEYFALSWDGCERRRLPARTPRIQEVPA